MAGIVCGGVIILLLFIILFYSKRYGDFLLPSGVQKTPMKAERFENQDQEEVQKIPTYALYQPENSGRHLNFFSHAPKETPYYPQNVWSSTIQDPYFQPIYKNYFYQNGYYYPLF